MDRHLDTKAPNQIAPANARWRLQFRFAVHVCWSGVAGLQRYPLFQVVILDS
jgi:hypothetical protein